MAKQELTKQVLKSTLKTYEKFIDQAKRLFDAIGDFYSELEIIFGTDKNVGAIHSWWEKAAEELKLDNIDAEDLDDENALITGDNDILDLEIYEKTVVAKVTNYMAKDGEYTRFHVPMDLVLDPKKAEDVFKKYLKEVEKKQKKYDEDAPKVVARFAEEFIAKYGNKLGKINAPWDKFHKFLHEKDPNWDYYRIAIKEVYTAECLDHMVHLFVIYEDRRDNSGVYVSGLTSGNETLNI